LIKFRELELLTGLQAKGFGDSLYLYEPELEAASIRGRRG
jgi:hypothetical protein